jgi:hypothetical protein
MDGLYWNILFKMDDNYNRGTSILGNQLQLQWIVAKSCTS